MRALNVKHLITDPRFLDNRLRIKNSKALDDELQEAILKFDQSTLIKMFDEVGAAELLAIILKKFLKMNILKRVKISLQLMIKN